MAFPDDPLGARVDLQVGGVWTDVTADAYTRDPITITRGQPDGAAVSDPSRCTVTLNNKDGKYSPRNPMSPYYGQIGRNTPIRVSVAGSTSYLSTTGAAGAGAQTPDHASLDITGDLDIRVEAEGDWWSSSNRLFGKWGSVGQQSYRIQVERGTLYLIWSPDGGTNPFFAGWTIPADTPRRAAFRVTLDVDNGAGKFYTEFFTAPTLDGPWTRYATFTGDATTSIFNSTTPLTLGGFTVGLTGPVYRAELRNGINGTIVASPDLRALAPGTTSWTDSSGRPWTLMGQSGQAEVTNRAVRFHGVVSSWPPRWAPSGQDVWTPIEAAGTLRRLGQGKKALASTLLRRLPSQTSLLAYWPCEDSAGSTQAYSPLSKGSPLSVTGWDFAQDDTLGGSSPLPVIAPGGTMRGQVPAPATASTVWAVCMPYRVDGAAPAVEQEMLSWSTSGTARRWRITMGSSGSHIFAYDAAGALILDSAISTTVTQFAGWHRLEFTARQNGGNISYTIRWTRVNGVGISVSGSIAGTVGRVTSLDTSYGPGLPDIRVGHIGVFSADVVGEAYASADHGYNRERAASRLWRLAGEESRTVSLLFPSGYSYASMPLGPQRPETLLDLFQQCADSDLGVLTEDRATSALAYRSREYRYNLTPRMVLDYAAGDVAPPLEPVDDDQATRNDRTVNRIGGSSGRAVLESGPMSVQAPPAGVGLYDDSTDLSLADDALPQQIASWLLHLGTWDESRVPTVQLALHKTPHLIPA
ncbi:hypothetical protein, partial [Streptomyces sp. CC208A]|uniref:hypothetical protein n=1 Tax=Streptomyces sp. CC208A TaxID=3044573 RepID=UPI0024A96E71